MHQFNAYAPTFGCGNHMLFTPKIKVNTLDTTSNLEIHFRAIVCTNYTDMVFLKARQTTHLNQLLKEDGGEPMSQKKRCSRMAGMTMAVLAAASVLVSNAHAQE